MRTLAVAIVLVVGAVATWTGGAPASSDDSVEVRITARRLADGRIEFGLQQRVEGRMWGERDLPVRRFFPASGREGRWLGSSSIQLAPARRPDPSPTPTVRLGDTVAAGLVDVVATGIERGALEIGGALLTRIEVLFTNARGGAQSIRPGGVETIHWGQVGALDARGFNVGASDVCHSLGASMLEGACPGALKRTELRPGSAVRGYVYFAESPRYPLEFIVFANWSGSTSQPVETVVELPVPPGAPEKENVPARVVSFELVIPDSDPLEYVAEIRSTQPNGCQRFGGWSLARDDNRIAIDVWNTRPQPDASGYLACPFGPSPNRLGPSPSIGSRGRGETLTTILLGTDFEPGPRYEVAINADDLYGVEYGFVAQASPGPHADVRIVAKRHGDGRVEFGLQEGKADGSWGDRILPVQRFFPGSGSAGAWLSSTPIAIDIPSLAERLRDH